MKPNFDGCGKRLSLDFQTCVFGWKHFMCSCKCLLNELFSYENALIKIRMLTLCGLALVVSSSSPFPKISL